MASAADLNLQWLVRTRWALIFGVAGLALFGVLALDLQIPVWATAGTLTALALSNLYANARAHGGRPGAPTLLSALIGLDLIGLTGLLYLTGGPYNPLSVLYLVPVALTSVMLPSRPAAALTLAAVGLYGLLFLDHRPLPPLTMPPPPASMPTSMPTSMPHAHHVMGHNDHDMELHMRGMWLAFGLSAIFIVYFLQRLTSALSAREAELSEARARADRADRMGALATLAAGAAHELSTPLGTIAVAAGELSRDLAQGDTSDAAEDAALIQSQVARCRAVLDQLSDDAGATAGAAPTPTPLGQILDQALSALPPGSSEALSIEIPDLTLTTQPRALARALRGLIKNALDARASADPVLIQGVHKGPRLTLTITDTGPGMPPEVQARASEPFFTTKAPGQGMGLGLFVTRSLVEQLGGQLHIESTPGQGTTARIDLPTTLSTPPEISDV